MSDAPPVSSGRYWRRFVLWGLLLPVIAAGVVWGVRRVLPVSVATVTLESRDVRRTLVVAGRVRPPSRAGLGAAVAGVVSSVQVREGDRVASGDVVVQLDDREARAAVAQAEAALAETVAAVRAELERAESELAQAERDYDRVRAVYVTGGLTQQQVDNAERAVRDARTRKEAAQAAALASGVNASVARAQAALEGARARLALTRVTAPTSGTVLTRAVEAGDAVQPGRTLIEVAVDGAVEIVAFPSEENLSNLTPGARALVSADAYPTDTFEATVVLISPAVDAGQGTIEVRLRPDTPPPYLLPDMTVSVNIELGRRASAPVLPAEAIAGLGAAAPWVGVVQDGRVQRREVMLGLRGDDFVELVSGLSPGEQVVLSPGSLAIGARVRPRRQLMPASRLF